MISNERSFVHVDSQILYMQALLQMLNHHVPINFNSWYTFLNPNYLRTIIPLPQLHHLLTQRMRPKFLQLLALKRSTLELQTLLRSLRKPLIIRSINSSQIPVLVSPTKPPQPGNGKYRLAAT
jgi:hypothetical protein